MIEVHALHKSFRVHQKEPGLIGSVRSLFKRRWLEKTALKNINLRIESGEILGLIGANGAGKTTLVKCLAGIIHPTSGEATVLGHVPWLRENSFRRQVALIMGQKAQLWWDLPAGDCFILLREIYQIPKREFDESLDFLSSTLGTHSLMKTQIRRLSLGERMKMELIAALVHRPKVVYLDEPTIGLDLTAQRAIREFILKYRTERRPAMILTSHYMEDIERLCERIVILREGVLVYDGPIKQVIEKHATHKVIVIQTNLPDAGALEAPPPKLGEVLLNEGGTLKLKVARGRVSESAAYLLSKHPVADLAIEEVEISSIIESLIRRPLS